MSRASSAAILWALSVLAAASAAAQGMPSAPSVRVENPGGATRVLGWDRDSVAVAPAAGVTRTGDRAAVEVRVDPATSQALEVRVPAGSRVWVRSERGEIEVDGVTGPVTAVSGSGRIRVGGAPREVTVETLDGNIEIAAAAPLTRVRSASGTVVVRGVTGELVASTVSGPIYAGGNPLARARLETVSGAIAFKGRPTRDGTLEFQSHGGSVELRLPPDLSAVFDVAGLSGGFVNELVPGAPRPARAGAPVRFRAGAGEAQVTVRTFKGTVKLLRQEGL